MKKEGKKNLNDDQIKHGVRFQSGIQILLTLQKYNHMFSSRNAKKKKLTKKRDNEKCPVVPIINHLNMVRLFGDACQKKDEEFLQI